MSVSQVEARRSLVGRLDVAVGLVLGVVLMFATVLVSQAWSSGNAEQGGPIAALALAAGSAAVCALVALTRPAIGLCGGACLVVLIVVGRLTWTVADLDVDPWSFDIPAIVGYGSSQPLTWACAAVLLVGGVVSRARQVSAGHE